ncbi:hypothetical protein VNO80_14594 [Phaseolus coccineus]|uniref:NADH dehydrogenase [ubiquinone] 1 alpha subcomplex subunit 13 n=1 Tax=Phaseolus coccineus TaxID=3886 RepID=A0AAN9R217_PHACN
MEHPMERQSARMERVCVGFMEGKRRVWKKRLLLLSRLWAGIRSNKTGYIVGLSTSAPDPTIKPESLSVSLYTERRETNRARNPLLIVINFSCIVHNEWRKRRDRKKMTEATIRNKPGMASVKDMPVLQDGPPPGGFAPVRFARRIPNKGPSAVAIFLATFGTFSWGMYQVGQGNKIRRALKEEKYSARRSILPVLQAEEDERFVREWNKYLEHEAEVMKDVPGWKVGESVYNSGRWVPPASGELRPDIW